MHIFTMPKIQTFNTLYAIILCCTPESVYSQLAARKLSVPQCMPRMYRTAHPANLGGGNLLQAHQNAHMETDKTDADADAHMEI